MSAKELLNLPPAEWEHALEAMSWRELKDTAEKIRRAARRVLQLEDVLNERLDKTEA